MSGLPLSRTSDRFSENVGNDGGRPARSADFSSMALNSTLRSSLALSRCWAALCFFPPHPQTIKHITISAAATPKAFFDGIGSPNARLAFEMEDAGVAGDKGAYRFHHCALVEAWKNLGASPEEVAHLCDLASCGDHGVISCSPGLELKFNSLIARGDAFCELEVTKKQ